MPRCLTCGRRVAGIHDSCGSAPPLTAPEPASAPEVPGWRAREVLGAGGFGVVLAAESATGRGRAALKVARPGVAAAAAQLRREIDALRAIGPPAVPAVLASGALDDGTPWVAIEHVAAPTLAQVVEQRGGPLAPDELALLAPAFLEALAAVHAAGWAHGDLKPENVLVEEGGRVRLIDLGLAEPLDGALDAAARDELAGTVEYMAPEQCEGRRSTAASDVYAAGVLLFELATGRTPFFGAAGEVRHAHLTQRPPRPGSLAPVAPGLEAAILRCLGKTPEERFPSLSALRGAIAAEISSPAPPTVPVEASPPRAAPAPSPGGARPRSSRRRVGVAFIETSADVMALQRAAAALGGVLAHAERGRGALVFDPAAGENPVRLALSAAWQAVVRGLAGSVRVDLLAVVAQPGASGPDRYLSASFGQPASWPGPTDPRGVSVTARAADVLPGEPLAAIPGRADVLACVARPSGEEATVVRHGAPPLVGRDDVLAHLRADADGALEGPVVVSVVGAAGVGKTHLAAVLSERLRAAGGAQVVELRARPRAEAPEGSVTRALVAAALGLAPGAPAPSDGGRTLIGLALPEGGDEALWAGAALALGWIAPDAPVLRARAAAPGALSSLTVRATAALLRARAGTKPLAIVLDDAHLADGAALDALELAALAEGRAVLFVCALARPTFSDVRPAWGERAGRARALRLEPLEPAHAAELCRRLLAPVEAVPARAVEWLVGRSQGVPLLLAELVRGLKRDGLVRAHAHGGSHYLATDELDRFPDMPVVEWLASRELQGLPPGLAAHAQLAALLGDELTAGELPGALAELERSGHAEHFPLDAAAATRRLVAMGLLVTSRSGRTRFRLPLVRDALARGVPDALRRSIHEAAFRFYQGADSAPASLRLGRLALHAAAAGHNQEASAIELRLAGDLAARHAYLEAEACYSRALEHLQAGDSPERLRALRGRALVRTYVGRTDDALGDLGCARALARRVGDRSAELACMIDEATALDWKNDYGGARARAREAEDLARGVDHDLQARLELARGLSLFRASRWEEAAATLASAARLAEARGDEEYETLVAALLLLGTSLPAIGRARDGEAALARVQEIAATRGDLAHVGSVLINRRNLLIARQDLDGAIRDQLESVRIGREMGVVATEYVGEFNLAELHYQAGDTRGAEPHLRRGAEIEERRPQDAPLPLTRLLWARALVFTGDLAGARRRHDEFLEALARARARGAVLGPSETVLADMVELVIRDGSEAEWEALVARSSRDSVEQEPIEVLEMRGLSALRAGRLAQARDVLRSALDLAGRIPNLLAPRIRRALQGAGG